MIRAIAWAGALITLTYSANLLASEDTYEVITAPSMQAPEASQAVLTELASTAAGDFAVGDYGIVLRRTQGGDWQQAEVPTSVFLSSVSFADENHGWAVGHHGVIIATTDGGETWHRQLDGFELIELRVSYFEQAFNYLDQLTEDEVKADPRLFSDFEFLVEDALFRFENAEYAREEGPTLAFLDVLALDKQTILVAGAYGTLLRSEDGGNTWQVKDTALDNPDGYHLNALAADDQYLYLAGESGVFYRSADAGETWDVMDSPYFGSFFGMHIDKQNRLWLFGLRGNIFVSEDQGQSFSAISLKDPVNINAAIDGVNGGVYLVGNAGALAWVSADGEIKETRHESGAALTDVILNDDHTLTLVGQRGLLTMPASVTATTQQ